MAHLESQEKSKLEKISVKSNSIDNFELVGGWVVIVNCYFEFLDDEP